MIFPRMERIGSYNPGLKITAAKITLFPKLGKNDKNNLMGSCSYFDFAQHDRGCITLNG